MAHDDRHDDHRDAHAADMDEAAAAAAEVADRRGPDEIDFLSSRQELPPLSESLAHERANAIERRAVSNDKDAGGKAHDEGEDLNNFYLWHGERALAYRSFNRYLAERWPVDAARARESMRVARFFTRAEASEWGVTICLLGYSLIRALGLYDPEAKDRTKEVKAARERLARTKLELPASLGGGTTTFPASARLLRGALGLLRGADADDSDEELAGRKLQRTRAWLSEQAASDEEIAALQPTASLVEGEVMVRVSARGRSGAVAATRLYEQLAKRR